MHVFKLFKNKYIIFVLLAVVGLVDALYLSVSYYSGTPLSCNILDGCNIVARSEYASMLGVPLAYWGVVYYLGAILFATYLNMFDKGYFIKFIYKWHLFLLFAITGAAMSVYFLFVQVFWVNAICIYCLISEIATWLMLIPAIKINNLSHIQQIEIIDQGGDKQD